MLNLRAAFYIDVILLNKFNQSIKKWSTFKLSFFLQECMHGWCSSLVTVILLLSPSSIMVDACHLSLLYSCYQPLPSWLMLVTVILLLSPSSIMVDACHLSLLYSCYQPLPSWLMLVTVILLLSPSSIMVDACHLSLLYSCYHPLPSWLMLVTVIILLSPSSIMVDACHCYNPAITLFHHGWCSSLVTYTPAITLFHHGWCLSLVTVILLLSPSSIMVDACHLSLLYSCYHPLPSWLMLVTCHCYTPAINLFHHGWCLSLL